MADNIELDAGSGGAKLATAAVTFSDETADVQICGLGIVSGSAESYSVALVSAGAGAVGGGVQRMTLASDDPAVALLTTIDVDTGVMVVDLAAIEVLVTAGNADLASIKMAVEGTLTVDGSGVTQPISGTFWQATQPVSGTVTTNAGTGFSSLAVVGGGTEATALRMTLANDSTGTLTVDTTGTSGLEVVQVTAADLNMTEASAAAIKTAVQLIDNSIAVFGDATYTEATTSGTIAGVVRNDVLAPLADTNNEIAPLQVDSLGSLWTTASPNLVDSGNSTTTPLGNGATFVGDGVDTLRSPGITIQLFADQDSAANGMRFEFSTDNSNWDISKQFDYVANTGREFQFTAVPQYFRVVFVNGTTPQSAIRIQTVLHRNTIPSTTIHRLDDPLAPDRSAQVVKASIMAQRDGGSDAFIPVNATNGGNLKVSVEEVDSPLPTIAKPDSSVVYYSGTAYTVKRFNEVVTTDGDDIIPAPTGTKNVLLLELDVTAMSATETEWYLQTVTTGTDIWGNATNGFLFALDSDGDNVAGRRWHSEFGIMLSPDSDEAIEVKMSSNQPMHFSGSYIEVA